MANKQNLNNAQTVAKKKRSKQWPTNRAQLKCLYMAPLKGLQGCTEMPTGLYMKDYNDWIPKDVLTILQDRHIPPYKNKIQMEGKENRN